MRTLWKRSTMKTWGAATTYLGFLLSTEFWQCLFPPGMAKNQGCIFPSSLVIMLQSIFTRTGNIPRYIITRAGGMSRWPDHGAASSEDLTLMFRLPKRQVLVIKTIWNNLNGNFDHIQHSLYTLTNLLVNCNTTQSHSSSHGQKTIKHFMPVER